jgi:hypothetical protein
MSTLATPTYVQNQASLYLPLTSVGTAYGPIPLGAGGRVSPAQISASSTQRWPTPFLTPTTYNAAAVTATTTPVTVYTAAVANPGFTYKLLVHGTAHAKVSLDNGEYPQFTVRAGSTSGQIVASGDGLGSQYLVYGLQSYTAAGTFVYNIPSSAAFIDGVIVGGGGAGIGGYNYWNGWGVVAAGGASGSNGAITTFTIARGTDIPWGTTQLTLNVGAGGVGGVIRGGVITGGGASSVTTTSGYSKTAAGGTAGTGAAAAAAAVGTVTYQGITYTGGAANTNGYSAAGFPPGGGGNGGLGANSVGGNGAAGAVWLSVRYSSDSDNYSPVVLAPRYASQTPMTGATTLYVIVKSSGSSATVTASTALPSLWITPIPA